jgi:hypothetical protein
MKTKTGFRIKVAGKDVGILHQGVWRLAVWTKQHECIVDVQVLASNIGVDGLVGGVVDELDLEWAGSHFDCSSWNRE